MVYQPHRTLPPVNTLKRILDTGVLGDIFMIKRATSTYMRRNDWQALRAYGGGMLNNYGAHYIDQMRYLTGEKLTEVACRCHKIASLGDADDVVKIILKTESGITVDVDINEATAYEITPWMVMGQYGTVICYQERDADPYQFHVKYVDPGDLVPLTLETGLAAPNRRYSNEGKIPWKEEVYEVKQEDAIEFYQKCYEYFALNQEAFVPFEQTVDLMEIIDRCHKLAQF